MLFRPFEGRSAALFAVLAGVSIALMSGGRAPKAGQERTRVGLRIAARAPLLLGIGLWLASMNTGYIVILAFYGVCFLLIIPFLRAGAKACAMLALGAATVLPVLSWILRAQIAPRELVPLLPDATLDTLSTAGPEAMALALLLTGTFPAVGLITYSPAWLVISTPHSYTPFDFLACIGVAAAVIGACLLLAERFERTLRPLAALGSVILSAYVGHFIAIRLLWPAQPPFSALHFLLFALVAVAAAVAWRQWIGRGPLEWGLHVTSNWPVRLYDSWRAREPFQVSISSISSSEVGTVNGGVLVPISR